MQLLIYAPAYARIEQAVHARVPNVKPLLMHPDGTFTLDGATVSVNDVQPVAAWVDADLYQGPVRDFMIACLKSSSLRWLQSSAAGFEHPVFGKLVEKGVVLTNSDAGAVAIAEFVLASVFACFQPDVARARAQAAGHWERAGFREVHGSTWLVVGVGRIGSELAKRARVLGAHVIGVRRHPRGDEPVHEMITPDLLATYVPRADVVVLSASSNAASLRIVGEPALSAMRPGSVLINVARGALVDEHALLRALDRGIPERAILDVFETEPLPPEHAFWTHPRVRVTAHCAAAGSGFQGRNDSLFLDNLERFARGTQLSHVVPRHEVPGAGTSEP